MKSTVTIVTATRNDGLHSLRIFDEVSGALVCDITMTPAQFAAQVTGATTPEVAVHWVGIHNIGKRLETKEEIVVVDGRSHSEKARRESAKRAIELLEVDGWKGDISDANNPHRRVGQGQHPSDDTFRDGIIGDAYRVRFSRYVDPS